MMIDPSNAKARLLSRAVEVVHHDRNCDGVGMGDKHCTCDAVPFLQDLAAALVIDRALRPGTVPEQAVMVCPQCEGEGGYPDGVDEGACHTDCTRCGGNGWIVDLAALRPVEIDPTYPGRYLTPGMGEALDALTRPAAMPGDVVEAVERAIQDQANPGFGVSDQSKRQATAALTAMQPAIQAAVEALEKIAADDERPSHPCDGPSYGHFGSIATKALATLRTVTALRAKEVSDHG